MSELLSCYFLLKQKYVQYNLKTDQIYLHVYVSMMMPAHLVGPFNNWCERSCSVTLLNYWFVWMCDSGDSLRYLSAHTHTHRCKIFRPDSSRKASVSCYSPERNSDTPNDEWLMSKSLINSQRAESARSQSTCHRFRHIQQLQSDTIVHVESWSCLF